MSLPHPTTLTSIHASLPHFLPSPALASPVGSPSSQPNIAVSNAPCSTLFVANLGQFVSEHELKDIFSRSESVPSHPFYRYSIHSRISILHRCGAFFFFFFNKRDFFFTLEISRALCVIYIYAVTIRSFEFEFTDVCICQVAKLEEDNYEGLIL